MKKLLVIVLAAVASLAALQAYSQNAAEGTVLAFDRKANVLVFTDKTVWPLSKLTAPAPEGLKAGDHVEIFYSGNEDDGVVAIDEIRILSK